MITDLFWRCACPHPNLPRRGRSSSRHPHEKQNFFQRISLGSPSSCSAHLPPAEAAIDKAAAREDETFAPGPVPHEALCFSSERRAPTGPREALKPPLHLQGWPSPICLKRKCHPLRERVHGLIVCAAAGIVAKGRAGTRTQLKCHVLKGLPQASPFYHHS